MGTRSESVRYDFLTHLIPNGRCSAEVHRLQPLKEIPNPTSSRCISYKEVSLPFQSRGRRRHAVNKYSRNPGDRLLVEQLSHLKIYKELKLGWLGFFFPPLRWLASVFPARLNLTAVLTPPSWHIQAHLVNVCRRPVSGLLWNLVENDEPRAAYLAACRLVIDKVPGENLVMLEETASIPLWKD